MSQATVIIPVHNRQAITLACLRHLRAHGDLERFHVIVVDDGSTDGTGAAIQAEFPSVEVLRGDGNLWWTGAIALGMERAFATGADAVCWLNDDCLPEPGTLQALLDEALAPPGRCVAPACFAAGTGAPVPNAFVGRTRLPAGSSEKLSADGLSGFCVAVPRAVWSKVGLPDARRFPHYFGDNAYTLRATRAGFPCVGLGSVRAELTAFHAVPDLRVLRDPTLGWGENFQRSLRSPKSAYRLGTLFAYQRLKYGAVAGTLFASARAASWIIRWCWIAVTG